MSSATLLKGTNRDDVIVDDVEKGMQLVDSSTNQRETTPPKRLSSMSKDKAPVEVVITQMGKCSNSRLR